MPKAETFLVDQQSQGAEMILKFLYVPAYNYA